MVVGVDEVGRGCLAGNVVACAVVLSKGFVLNEIDDSKKLTATKRQSLARLIMQNCQFAMGEATPKEIDEMNILNATMLAMKRAISKLNVDYQKVLVDGNKCPNVANCTAIIKGDNKEKVIAAASIVAKVWRDKQMIELDKVYQEYGFAQHKGYGTEQHLQALTKFGALENLHRFSFSPVRAANLNLQSKNK